MKRILVPVDFSPQTETFCHFALEISRKAGADIILFHSFFDQVYFSDGGFATSFESGLMMTDEIILDFYKQKESSLRAIADRLQKKLNASERASTRITCQMESGDPEVQIIKAIERLHPDLIIMGSTGMGKKRIMSGSVARRIIDNTAIPVLAVPAEAATFSLKRIAYMTAFETTDFEHISAIEELFAMFEPDFTVIHVITGQDEKDPGIKMASLSEQFMLVEKEKNKKFHILTDNEHYDNLRHFLDNEKIDLIAFIPHKRNFFKNLFHQGITREDLFLTHIPILAVRLGGKSGKRL